MSGNTSATGGYIIEIPPGPPTGEQITAALQATVRALTGLPGNLVRPRWQPMPPTQPDAGVTWASVGTTHMEADDYPVITHDGLAQLVGAPGPGVDRMTRHVTITAVVTFYGPEAEDVAGTFRDAFYVQQNWEPLHVLGLNMREVADLARAPELINQQWIDRIDIKLEMRGQLTRVYPVLNLDGADVVIHRPNADGSVTDTSVSVRETTATRP
jgi:hypothetical protein